MNSFEQKLQWFTYKHDSLQIKEPIREQSFEDFIKNGPLNENIPADIMLDLYEVIINAIE